MKRRFTEEPIIGILREREGKVKGPLAEAHRDNAGLKGALSRECEADRQADGGLAPGLGPSRSAGPGHMLAETESSPLTTT